MAGEMKKILGGCLIVLVIAAIGLAAAGFYAYRAMRPVIDNASTYMDKAREVSKLGEDITIKTPYQPPASGELTQQQVERFIAVQTRVRADLGDRWDQVEKKSKELKARTEANHGDWTFSEFTGVFSDIANIWVEARKSQVKAINIQRFSEQEYEWVRKRVYEAAGVQLAGNIDLAKIEALARDNAAKNGVTIPQMDLPKVPEKNVELVKAHATQIKEWIPMAALGL
jgi:hypothetical protein